MDKLQALVFQLLNKRKNYPDEELHNYVLMLAVSIVACTVHVTFSIFFFVVGSLPLAVSHVIGVFIFVLAFWLLERRHYDMSGTLLAVMILFSTLATIYMIGGDNFSILYQFIVLLMLLIIPFTNKKIPLILGGLLPFIMVGSYLYTLHNAPVAPIGTANEVLAVMNIVVAATGVVLLLSLDRIIRGFIENFKQKKLRELEVQATVDPLTGLYNRRYATTSFERLASNLPEGESYIAIADIDDFKLVNDTYGHEAGDAVLRMISDTFRANTRKSDLIFRWGGEEFLLILQSVSAVDAFRLLDKIRARIQETPVHYKNTPLRVTITIGATKLNLNDISQSIETCDKKMYEGKKSSKNVVVI